MKKKVCMIGPFPPPINGNSKALETIRQSKSVNDRFDLEIVNLYELYGGKTGKLSLSKITGLYRLKRTIKKIRKQEKTDTYYISISQTTVGCIRDIAVIKEILKQKKPYKIVLHLHGGGLQTYYSKANIVMRYLIRKYYSKADLGIVLGESLTGMFDGIINSEKITVIPNCVDNKMLLTDKEINEKIKKLSEKKYYQVLYLSNMIESKGYKDLFEAAVELHKQKENLKYVFAGAFKNKEDEIAFKKLIEEKNATEYIDYKGVISGEYKRNILISSDIFVLPTYYPNEGQPISIIECMSAGMPIIATNHAGIKDLVRDGVNGCYVDAKDKNSIIEALKKISDANRIVQFGINSREKAMDQFVEEKYITRICTALE